MLRSIGDFFVYVASALSFGIRVVRVSLVPPYVPAPVVAEHVALLVRRCMLPVTVVVFTVGAVMSLQAANLFKLVTAEPLLGGVTTLFTLREIGPVLAGMMIAAQGGTSVATEVGAMKIRQEFDALELMATDPIKYAIGPRFFAFVLSVPILTLLGNLAGVIGAFLVAMVATHATPYSFLESIYTYVSMTDIWSGLIKGLVFGTATACISCYNGYSVSGGAVEVGKAANRSVVYSMIALLALNYAVTTILFGSGQALQRF